MTWVVVGLAGLRGSGKSTLAASLQTRFAFARVSFGDYVRSVAQERTLPIDLKSLELLGQSLITEMGWEHFCGAVLKGTEAANRLVVDGVRHVAARTTIRNLRAPACFGLVYVEIDDDIRIRRLLVRARPSDKDQVSEMSDELAQLRREADLIVDGSRTDGPDRVMTWVESVSIARV